MSVERDYTQFRTAAALRNFFGGLVGVDLSRAAEAAGNVLSGDVVVAPLLELLSHPSALVREGAVYGLESFLVDYQVVAESLQEVARNDPSPGVRAAAAESIRWWTS